jgi:hypothetical protein
MLSELSQVFPERAALVARAAKSTMSHPRLRPIGGAAARTRDRGR